MKNKVLYTLVFLIWGALNSCNKSFLDVSSELKEEQDLEKLFSNPSEVRKWHRNIYTGIPNSMNFYWITNINGLGNPWTNLADELVALHRDRFPYTRPVSPSPKDNIFGRWNLYQLIRQANIFLERVQTIPESGDADYMKEQEVDDLKTQARFFRAYYHYLLFELYGPIPIMDKVVSPHGVELDFARNSVDEVVLFIYDELTDIADNLKDPDFNNQLLIAVPTKGTALAVRARLMIYAASPLYNGGYSEALSLTNKDGKQLFPAKDVGKWDKALAALQEFIDYAGGRYELHKEFTGGGSLDPLKSLYEVHMKMNKELIFVRSDDQGVILTSGPVGNIDRYTIPRGARGGTINTGGGGVLQELVDDFFMKDGLSIEKSTLYDGDGNKMYLNREPRFYQTVFYNERKWHIGGEAINFNKGGNSDNTNTSPRTGYLLYKRISQKVYHQAPNPTTEYRPMVVFRLAEFYLLYAEALNEVDAGDSRIIEYIDKVRERAGIPSYRKLHDDGIKTGVIGNQEAQREAIRSEMRVELATEGQRYFDVKRWMIAENAPGEGGLGGAFYGMDMNAPTLSGFYKRTVIQNRVFDRKEYLFPIPQDEVMKSKLLVQNPGY